MHKALLFLFFSLIGFKGITQDAAYIKVKKEKTNPLFSKKALVIPVLSLGYGITSLNNPELINLNHTINNNIAVKNPDNKIHVDDYLVYAPGVLTMGLQLAGIKATHSFKESILLYTLTNATVTAIVIPVKYISKEQRPDQSSYNAFPSGHTSMAFASAEFARLAYREKPWVGILGYSMATATGYLRMYNNRHWFGDVVAGAGIGILSAKFSYWLMEKIKKETPPTIKSF